MDVIDDAAYNGALAIVLDTSAKALISDNRYTLAERTLRIDHHIFVEDIADIDIDDTSFESCCGLVAFLVREWGLEVDSYAAKALFTGMVTDSGRFYYDSVTPRTFDLAGFLLSKGFNPSQIYSDLYVDTYENVKNAHNSFFRYSSQKTTWRIHIRTRQKSNLSEWRRRRYRADTSTPWLT